MAKRMSVTERILEDRPMGRGFEALTDVPQEEDNSGRRDERRTEEAEPRSAGTHSSRLVKATFLLDPESLEILDRIWLRQRKKDGESKSALVRQAIHWFRAKPRNRMEQVLETIGSLVDRAIVESRSAGRQAVAGVLTLVAAVVGSLFMGGALWLGLGEHRGAGDAMGIGILASLGATLILLSLGTALTCIVTYVAGSSTGAEDTAATPPDFLAESHEGPQAAGQERSRR